MIVLFLLPFITLKITNWGDFFKTYGQYILAYFFVVRSVSKEVGIGGGYIYKSIDLFQIILLVVVIIKVFMVKIVGYPQFENLFGELQLYYQRFDEHGRMKAFYLEPSYLGFVVVNMFWVKYYLSDNLKLLNSNLVRTLIILFLAQSAFAFLALFVIIIFELFYHYSKKSSLVIVAFFLLIVLILLLFSNKLIEIFRLDELLTSPDEKITSGFMRVILPIQVIYEMFLDGHIFGLTFGQLDFYVEKAFADFAEKGISNSFILIIGYFGILGFLMYAFLIFSFFKTNSRILKSFIILFFLNLNNSGAFVTSQYVFVSILIPILAIKLYDNKIINNYGCTK